MITLLIGLALGVVVAVIAPSLVPQQLRSALADSALRVVGLAMVVLSIASTSFVHVPDGRLGQLFRVYGGGPLTEGRILAVRGENGPQARILTPGFHLWLLVNVLYDVDTTKQEVNIPKGRVGLLTAKDGLALRAGQA